MKIGRYEIKLGRYCLVQTRAPTKIWHFLFLWVFKEVLPQDVDRRPQFHLGTELKYEGRVYRYCRASKSLTWKCHICGEERPDDKISVLSKPMVINGQPCGEQNIRYCNDRPACMEKAKSFSFFK